MTSPPQAREPGWYWVRLGEHWMVAQWLSGLNEWITCGSEISETVCDEIGPRILPPDSTPTAREPSASDEAAALVKWFCDRGLVITSSEKAKTISEEITHFAARAVAAERERCARIAEAEATCGCGGKHGRCTVDDAPLAIAAAIRSPEDTGTEKETTW